MNNPTCPQCHASIGQHVIFAGVLSHVTPYGQTEMALEVGIARQQFIDKPSIKTLQRWQDTMEMRAEYRKALKWQKRGNSW